MPRRRVQGYPVFSINSVATRISFAKPETEDGRKRQMTEEVTAEGRKSRRQSEEGAGCRRDIFVREMPKGRNSRYARKS